MNKITLCENTFEPESWRTYEVDDVCEFLQKQYGSWPENAKLYLNQVANSADITPSDEAGIEKLQKLTGHFYVVVYPEGIETILIIVAIAVAAAAIGLSFLLRPHVNSPNIKNQQETSPNNELSGRQNTDRLGQRIPDIFGKVWSTLDLIAVPYKVFVSGLEQEYSYMCVGKGSYTIDQVRDDLTPANQITGMSVEIYGPFTSPNSGTPVLRIGSAIGEPVRYVKASTSVNGQTLIAPNVTGAGFIGPFFVGDATTTDIWFNFTAESGSYSINGTTGIQSAVNTTIEVGITPVDASGTPTAGETLTSVTLNGSATLKNRIGATLKVTLSIAGMSKVRAHRTSNTTIAANISVSDEIKWRDCYAVAPVTQSDFGNVTTVQTLTLPTPEALAIKARKFNMLVTRNIPMGTLSGGVVTFAPEGPTKDAADIICAVAQDARIGNRTAAEIDFVGIYTAVDAAIAYFGTSLCGEFSYTFDDSKISFEETVADIAAAVFAVAYRRGSLLTMDFEKQTSNSVLLFNHRNKVPNSETRTVSFGMANDLDSIALTYVEPNDPLSPNQDVAKTLTFPINRFKFHITGGSAFNRYLWGNSIASVVAHNYRVAVLVTNLSLAPLSINTIGTSDTLTTGQTKQVQLDCVGDGVTGVQLQFNSINIGDELNFIASNPYIADLADGINIIAPAELDFQGGFWIPVSGATVTITPYDSPAINPKQIVTVGIRNNVQAYLLGWRLYNKLLYQNTVVEFTACDEASVLVRNNRILVADNTRSDVQDGHVNAQVGLLLTLSQNVTFIGGRTYTIYLQHYDLTVEAIGITAGPNSNQVILAGAPSIPLVIDDLAWVKTIYMIVDNTPQRANAFLLTEKIPQTGKTHNIKAVNYDDRYYQSDADFIKGFIVSNGEEGTGTPAIAAGATYRPTVYNNLNSSSGSSGLTVSAGTVAGFFIAAVPPNNTPPFSDGEPADNEPGDVIWNSFAPVRITTNTTLRVVVSAVSSNTKCKLFLNGVAVTLTGAGTYTATILANTFLSTIMVEAQANPTSGGNESITITDINIS